VIKCISGWWYLVNAGAFHGYPFPTKQDAAEALQALVSGWWYLVNAGAFHGYPFPTKQDAAEALQALEAQA